MVSVVLPITPGKTDDAVDSRLNQGRLCQISYELFNKIHIVGLEMIFQHPRPCVDDSWSRITAKMFIKTTPACYIATETLGARRLDGGVHSSNHD
jgi:hypothetical protein